MLKLIFFSDTHLGIDMPLRPKKDRRRRGPDYFNNFEKVLHYAVENKADLVIHGGDVFDKPTVHQSIVDLAYSKFFNLAEQGIPLLICPGNHERSVLAPSLYLNHQNIQVFKQPQVFSYTLKGHKLQVAGFPFHRKNIKEGFPDICEQQLEPKLDDEAFKILLMHQAIEGAVVGPQRFRFTSGKDVVQIDDIPDEYDLILSGHIHPSQVLRTKSNKPIVFCGSTERTAFAEKDEQKGFYEINIAADKTFDLKFILLYARPMKVLRLEKDNYTQESIIMELKAAIADFPNDAVVQIRLKDDAFASLLPVKVLDMLFPITMNYAFNPVLRSFRRERKNK